MILSNASLIALAMHLSSGASVNDLQVFNSLSNGQKAVVIQLVNEGDLPPKYKDYLNGGNDPTKGQGDDPNAPKPTPKPKPKPKPGGDTTDSTVECHDE